MAENLENLYDHTFTIGKIFAHDISLNNFTAEEMDFRVKNNIAVIEFEMG